MGSGPIPAAARWRSSLDDWDSGDPWALRLFPPPVDPATLVHETAESDDEEAWGIIPGQDFANMPKVQTGMHSSGLNVEHHRPDMSRNCGVAGLAEEVEGQLDEVKAAVDVVRDLMTKARHAVV